MERALLFIIFTLSVFFLLIVIRKELNLKRLLEEKEKLFRERLHPDFETFRITSSYQKISRLNEQEDKQRKCFNSEERQRLKDDIKISFTKFSEELQASCPGLSPDEIVFCCLVKSGIAISIIGFCFGNTDLHALKQRRYRIHKKMRHYQCEKLFDSIFTKNE
ncbi:MAG: hypothetical protein LBU22_15085 [Dysgonamonadaceae bacterium]|jgi:hypothetical protein|nr:hypothetical protein [Dysgonamonadaceae bacterium]